MLESIAVGFVVVLLVGFLMALGFGKFASSVDEKEEDMMREYREGSARKN